MDNFIIKKQMQNFYIFRKNENYGKAHKFVECSCYVCGINVWKYAGGIGYGNCTTQRNDNYFALDAFVYVFLQHPQKK